MRQASIREHEPERRGDAEASELRPHSRQIALGQRHRIGVRYGCRTAFVFADLTDDLRGDGDEELWKFRLDEIVRLDLMGWIAIGMQEHDGNRSGVPFDQLACSGDHAIAVERRANTAICSDALGDFEAEVAGDQRRWILDCEVVEL